MKEEQKKNRAKLVAALRSGEYKQTQNQLYNGDGYCCLGVACDIFSKEVGGEFILDKNHYYFNFKGKQSKNYLTQEVQEFFGFQTHCGSFNQQCGNRTNLTILNDDRGKSFLEIADIIESEPEGLCE